jgi:fumarylacetoacetase
MRTIDETHRPELGSWVVAANDPATDFPVQNLPFGVFSRPEGERAPRCGIAIGDSIVDVSAAAELGLFGETELPAALACAEPGLNTLMAMGGNVVRALRAAASRLLRDDTDEGKRAMARAREILVPMRDAAMHLPAEIGDYTDFYASLHHATNVGSMFRPDNPLLPNYKWVPIGYHGRSSSIVVSGTPVRRPTGQTRNDPAGPVSVGPSTRLDYELELGAFVGPGNAMGETIPMHEAESHLFGLCLVNDWSARDIQSWEYQPLGPFLAKNFATTVSPWVVTLDALAPFRASPAVRPVGDPAPLAYLSADDDRASGAFDITLEVRLSSASMRASGAAPMLVSRGRFVEMYWTVAQLLTHHASNGCPMRAGDLIASGTVSGATPDSRGCLLERTWRGTEPLALPTGEQRRFLEDGDEVTLRGWCERDGARRIGFGECRGVVTPAR